MATGGHSYNEVLPLMLARYCGPGLLGLGITALIAGFMSGMAGNVSAFSTVWTYDIYGALIKKNASDKHYVSMGRWSHGRRRVDQHRNGLPGDAISQHHGLCAGAVQFFHRAAVRHGDPGHAVEARHAPRVDSGDCWQEQFRPYRMWAWVKLDPSALRYVALSSHARDMAENMYRGLWSWLVCVIVTVVISLMTTPKPVSELNGLGDGRYRYSLGGTGFAVAPAGFLGCGGGRGVRDLQRGFLVSL